MGEFLIPDGPTPQPALPPDPMVAREEKIANDTRVEQALNRFLSAKQATLFDAPDAFYRAQGEDAIHAAPVVSKNLDQLRSDLLDGLGNDYQRQRLGDVLDAQMQLTRDGMARHVAEQSLAWQRGIAQDRIAILTKEAAQHHNDTDLVDALGHAAATAARAHSRVGDGPPGGEAEDAAAAQARSGVLGAAIQARLDRGDTAGANALLTRVQGQLDPAHAAPLQGQIDTMQRLATAKDYADGIASATPAASLEEIDAQHQVALQQAEADHPDDPRQQTLARHFLNQAFDARRQELQQGDGSSANAVDEWLNTPGADGGPQRDLPPPAVLSRLDDDAVRDLVFRLGRDGRGLKVVPLPYKPSLDGTLDEASMLRNLANVPEGENTPGQNSGGIVPVNHTPDDATGAAQAEAELAQASPPSSTKKQPAVPKDNKSAKELEDLRKELEKIQSEKRDKREPLWDAMTKAEPPDGAPGTKKQAPLSDDWRADVNKINPIYADLVEKIAKQHGIPPELLARLLAKESNFDKNAGIKTENGKRVPDGAVGIPQMYPAAAKDVGITIQQLIDGTPEFQINAGAAYLAQKYKQFQDWPKAVAAYHSGAPVMDAWFKGEGPDYESVEQRKLGYQKLDTSGSIPKLSSVLSDSNKIKKEVNNWTELKGYLPYVFLGDPDRYKYVRVPEYP